MRTFVRGLMWIMGILAVVLGILYAFVFDVWTVPSDDPAMTASIAPTLGAGDVVLVSRHGTPDRRNLLRCADPDAPGRFVIARELAVATDVVDIVGESVNVGGGSESMTGCDQQTVTIDDPTTHEPTELTCARTDSGGVSHELLRGKERSDDETKVTVDPGRIFLVSDDLHFHQDSRDYGQIDPSTCQHLVFRLTSAAGIGDRARRFTLLW